MSHATCVTEPAEFASARSAGGNGGDLLSNLDKYNLSRAEWENMIDQWIIGHNAERNRKILKRRLLDGICYEPLAEEFDLSIQQVKSIVYRERSRLFKHIE